MSLDTSAQPDGPGLGKIITERLTQLLQARVGALYLTQPDGQQRLQHVCGAGDSHPAIGPDHLLNRLASQAALSGRVLLPDGFHHEGHFFSRILCLPLQAGGKVIGALAVADDRKPEPFTEHEIRLAGLFAEQAAAALEDCRSREADRPNPCPPTPPGPAA